MPSFAAVPLVLIAMVCVALAIVFWGTTNSPSIYLVGLAIALAGGAVASYGSPRAGLAVVTAGLLVIAGTYIAANSG